MFGHKPPTHWNQQVTSKDGTRIAFDQSGQGPAVILVCGASVDRSDNAPLAEALAPRFTVFNYDRRGRGDSSDTPPYAAEREVEDIEAVITAAGGSAQEALAHTLAYDATIMGDSSLPVERAALVSVPSLVMAGEAGFPFMRVTTQALAQALPKGQLRLLTGQTHDINPQVMASVLEEFFTG